MTNLSDSRVRTTTAQEYLERRAMTAQQTAQEQEDSRMDATGHEPPRPSVEDAVRAEIGCTCRHPMDFHGRHGCYAIGPAGACGCKGTLPESQPHPVESSPVGEVQKVIAKLPELRGWDEAERISDWPYSYRERVVAYLLALLSADPSQPSKTGQEQKR